MFQMKMDSTVKSSGFKAETPKTDSLVEQLHDLSFKVLRRYDNIESKNPAHIRAIKLNSVFVNDANSEINQRNLLNGLAVFLTYKANELINNMKGPDLSLEAGVRYTRMLDRSLEMRVILDKKAPITMEQVEKLNNAVGSFEQVRK